MTLKSTVSALTAWAAVDWRFERQRYKVHRMKLVRGVRAIEFSLVMNQNFVTEDRYRAQYIRFGVQNHSAIPGSGTRTLGEIY